MASTVIYNTTDAFGQLLCINHKTFVFLRASSVKLATASFEKPRNNFIRVYAAKHLSSLCQASVDVTLPQVRLKCMSFGHTKKVL